VIADALLRASLYFATATPSPTPSSSPDPNNSTPGVIGFLVTFAIAVVVVLLVIDMVRRIRRVRYRAEIAEKLDAEQAAARDDRAQDDERP
jgi:capsular polysaccharide biosynthesis protein